VKTGVREEGGGAVSEETSQNTVEDQLRSDLKDATRQRDQVRMDTIRMALTAFRNEEVARSRQALSEQDRYALLDKQIKQRRESADLFRQGNRPELAEKEEREAQILAAYLPARLSDDEIRAVVSRLIEENGKEFRKVMPLASKETKGRADGKRVSEIVREMTA
jgi:uncharacterized protein YqeY